MEGRVPLTDQDSRPIVQRINYRNISLANSDMSSSGTTSPTTSLPLSMTFEGSIENARNNIHKRHSSSTSIKTSKTVATSSMKTVEVRSTSASTTKSSFTGSSKIIDASSRVVENITEMQNLFRQTNVSESMLEKMEGHCQSLETLLPTGGSRMGEPLFSSRLKDSLTGSANGEIGRRFNQVKKRTNLAYLRLLRQLVNDVGLDGALSSSPGLPILEAFCSCPISTTPVGIEEDSEASNVVQPSRRSNGGDRMRHAVCMLMNRGKDAAKDKEVNREFVALIEKMTNYNEHTCQDVIEQGGLDYVFHACRSEDVAAVKHAVISLANLLHRVGKEYQHEMVRRNTVAWLFLLALHPNEEIQYYTFLIVTILSNNRDLDAVLERSQLIGLVIPFVKKHNAVEFASRNFTDQTPIFSEDWLLFILPALTSDSHVEAQAFAAFHFAIAAILTPSTLQELAPANRASIESALVKVSGLKREPAWKLAALVLDKMGSTVPKALSLRVFHWPVEDVVCWMIREGFESIADKTTSLKIDGELLLGLTESEIEHGLGITNCIARRRFMRQLSRLKSMANYSQIDPTGVAEFLATASQDSNETSNASLQTPNMPAALMGSEEGVSASSSAIASVIPAAVLTQYTYNLLRHGVTRQCLVDLTEADLEHTCHITDAIHRRQLLKAVQQATRVKSTVREASENRIDFFISYRRSNGTHLASLIKTLLQLRKYHVFLDIERLKGGRFDQKLMDSIKRSDNFILILTEGALDRCSTDGSIDWVRKEINCALENNCHIIPLSDRFDWGNTDALPEDIRTITKFNSVQCPHKPLISGGRRSWKRAVWTG
uniref:ADP-ribosyl cyclase/cyclic ADP-ribose hydrolase n=1 Tax=Mesocestoides corti TaxID=53468 RepID=A0A5K3F208_MESCO